MTMLEFSSHVSSVAYSPVFGGWITCTIFKNKKSFFACMLYKNTLQARCGPVLLDCSLPPPGMEAHTCNLPATATSSAIIKKIYSTCKL